jgi:hypothetical protein
MPNETSVGIYYLLTGFHSYKRFAAFARLRILIPFSAADSIHRTPLGTQLNSIPSTGERPDIADLNGVSAHPLNSPAISVLFV